jgi:hypothetical protein
LFANNQYTDYEDTHALDKMGKKLLAKWWEVPPYDPVAGCSIPLPVEQ